MNVRLSGGRPGASGYFNWHRLQEILRDAGELKQGETLQGLEVTADGVRYTLESRATPVRAAADAGGGEQ